MSRDTAKVAELMYSTCCPQRGEFDVNKTGAFALRKSVFFLLKKRMCSQNRPTQYTIDKCCVPHFVIEQLLDEDIKDTNRQKMLETNLCGPHRKFFSLSSVFENPLDDKFYIFRSCFAKFRKRRSLNASVYEFFFEDSYYL